MGTEVACSGLSTASPRGARVSKVEPGGGRGRMGLRRSAAACVRPTAASAVRVVVICAALLSTVFAAAAERVAVTMSAEPAGRTPAVIGYNMGDNLPGSNVTSWLRRSGLNGARFWWSQRAWPDSPANWAGGDTGQPRFEAERAALRADPLARYDWNAHGRAVAAAYGGVPSGTIGECHSLSELHKLGAHVLVMLSHSIRTLPFDRPDGSPDWFGRWMYWRGVYLNAFYLARYYDVERFQLFNEPNHPNSSELSQADYLRRLQIGSDAVQAAVSDVNARFGKSLRVQVSAPVSAGLLVFKPRSGRADTRDANVGWGEMIVQHRQDPFPARSEPGGPLFHTYAFQAYGRDPGKIASGMEELRRLIAGANGRQPMPIIVSEMNVSTAADFSKTADTLDTPSYYAAFGAIAAAYVNSGIDEIYVFKLTQTPWGDGVKKNGTHLIAPNDPLNNILRSTKGAEAARLLMRGFSGGRTRFKAPAVPAGISVAAARDEKSGVHTLLVANQKAARTVVLDLTAWRVAPGAEIMVEEVSERHHGEVRQHGPIAANSRYTLDMAADSVALLTIAPPDAKPSTQPVMKWADTSRGRPFSKDPSVIRFGERYLMYYSIPPFGDKRANDGWAIGVAESRDLTAWNKVGELAPEQECERKGLCAPGAWVRDGAVHLFYQTYGNGPKDAICHAWSRDGVSFTRDPSNPVFAPTGEWTSGRAIDAEVFPVGDRLLLYFATRDPAMKTQMVGVAGAPLDSDYSRSAWRQLSDGPILKPELPWEKRCIEAPTLTRHGDQLYMFYAGGYNNEPQQIGVAVSRDGLHWQRLADQPWLPNGGPGEWNASESGHPGVMTDAEGRTVLFFQGNADKGRTWYLSRVLVDWRDGRPVIAGR